MVAYYCPITVLHRFRDMTTYWSKIAEKKPTLPSFGTFLWGDLLRIFRRLIPCQQLESWGYQTVYISRSCFRSARHNTGVWQTDRQTRCCRKDSVARVKRSPKNRELDINVAKTGNSKANANSAVMSTRPSPSPNQWRFYTFVSGVAQGGWRRMC